MDSDIKFIQDKLDKFTTGYMRTDNEGMYHLLRNFLEYLDDESIVSEFSNEVTITIGD